MRKYLMIAVALLLLSGCQESLEDRAAREVVEYTQKYCPQKLNDFTTLDSLTFDKATLTFTQYLTLSGNADNAERAREMNVQIKEEMVQAVITDTSQKRYKDEGYSFRFVARSQKDKNVILYQTTITKEDYQRSR